jgi:hypothetical protein
MLTCSLDCGIVGAEEESHQYHFGAILWDCFGDNLWEKDLCVF